MTELEFAAYDFTKAVQNLSGGISVVFKNDKVEIIKENKVLFELCIQIISASEAFTLINKAIFHIEHGDR